MVNILVCGKWGENPAAGCHYVYIIYILYRESCVFPFRSSVICDLCKARYPQMIKGIYKMSFHFTFLLLGYICRLSYFCAVWFAFCHAPIVITEKEIGHQVPIFCTNNIFATWLQERNLKNGNTVYIYINHILGIIYLTYFWGYMICNTMK